MSWEHPRYPSFSYLPQCLEHSWNYVVEYGELFISITVWIVVVHDVTNQTGTCGVVGYIWTSVDSGIMEEWRQSIAPIPKEKLEELQHAVPDDDRSEDESNNPTLPDKDDSSDSLVEDDDHISKFEKEVITYM